MTRTRIILASALLALAVAVPTALAAATGGGPFKFSNRRLYEASVAKQFVALELRKARLRYTVTGVGCAKTAVGHSICGLSATGPAGRQAFLVKVSCPDDSGRGCFIRATPEGQR